MALIINDLRLGLDPTQAYWAYCAGDSTGAHMVNDVIDPMLKQDPKQENLYRAGMAFQNMTLTMELRGIRIDEDARREAIKLRENEKRKQIQACNDDPTFREVWDEREVWNNKRHGKCNRIRNHKWGPRGSLPSNQTCSICGVARMAPKAFNPNSHNQGCHLLYDLIGLKIRRSRKGKNKGQPTVDADALEALALRYPEHASLIDRITEVKKTIKQISLLHTEIDDDGRWRHQANILSTETFRNSASHSPLRTGASVQNIANRSRNIFVADPDLELWYADMEQAESRIVAYDAEDDSDIRDHNSGDVHSGLAYRLWGETNRLEGFDPRSPTPWDPEHDFRHYAKIIRHGTNIGMTEYGIAREARISRAEAKKMRDAYFAAYPNDHARQLAIRNEVRATGFLRNPLGFGRMFLGRLWEENTQKEALAQIQQSMIAVMLNLAGWRIWNEMDLRVNIHTPPRPSDPNRVWMLAQIHDALLGQRRPGDNDALRRVREIMEAPVTIRGRTVVIPCEIMIGHCWRKPEAGHPWQPGDMEKWRDE